jgi:hypothetical protein
MTVIEVIEKYGKNYEYVVEDLCELAYYTRTYDNRWFDDFSHNFNEFDNIEIVEIAIHAEEGMIVIRVDTDL